MDDLGTKLGYSEYCTIPEDGQRHEIVDGVHFVNPAPGFEHQSALSQIFFELMANIDRAGRGRVFVAPYDVQLSEHDIVQPDIVVVLADNSHVITKPRIVGAPDLVVEILSPGTARHDRERKFALYEKSGIREYWIVDTAERVVSQFTLVDGRYSHCTTAHETLRLHVLPDVEIDLACAWK
ncbi:MAG: Uma2 family endonuclease [Planctomycetes bacterium]|nr:Uma2 family endonuclease [Planctomycetota bacterium]